MDYLQIKNWGTFQQYKDRNPPWIKLHTCLLEDETFEEMTDFNKLTLILLWLLASRLGNKIPNNIRWLQKKLSLSKKPNIDRLYELGYLEEWEDKEQCDWDSRHVPVALRKVIMDKYDSKCVVCRSKDNPEIDHIIPISKGGKTVENNLQVLCRSCNRQKNNKTQKSPYKPCTENKKVCAPETETETEREREKEKEKDKEIFDIALKIYPGTKNKLDVEFANFKKHKDWKEVLSLLKPAIEYQTKTLWKDTEKKFIPHFKTWINQSRWGIECPEKSDSKKICCVCGKPSHLNVSGFELCSEKCRKVKIGW